ncbi:hypothetical protein HPB52_002052 [Rhipicephalus sanguineus]|uniref:Uncharacterized protein n=1 Tax=Rhipicephalus sanguineus TaxID=34632 RepID=A0A9D4PIW9_RHISA|nr:hypothetical protein HPB52_002052 [Rhipicephalus sanguineus]
MGTGSFTTQMFPRDGLCDYIFYDSIYKSGITTFDPPEEADSGLVSFVEKRKDYSSTDFGIGFSYKYAPYVSSVLSRNQDPNSPFMLGYFWKQQIYNFGVLDTPTRDVKEASVKEAFDLLKIVAGFSDLKRAQGYSCIMVFAALVPNDSWANFYVLEFPAVGPGIFISLGHYDNGDNTFSDCHVMPPTVLSRPAQVAANNSSYEYDLTTAVASLNKLATTGATLVWATSVTMKGRWTVLEEGEQPEFLSRCVHDPSAESFGDVAKVCEDDSFKNTLNDFQVYSTLTYNSSHLFAFDDEDAFKQKLCRLKADHSSLDFGIAVFDLEYEDFSNACDFFNLRGAFSRLKALRHIIDFFRTNFKEPSDRTTCLSLTR